MIEFADMARGTMIALPLVARVERVWKDSIDNYETGQEERPGPWLVEPPATMAEFRPILKRQGIGREVHRQFAALRRFAALRTPKQMGEFANAYGLLGASQVRLGVRGRAEHFATWQRETREMAALLALWDLVRAERRDALRPFVWWNKEPLLIGIRFGWPLDTRSPRLMPINLDFWREPVIRNDDQQRPILCFAEMINGEDGAGQELAQRWHEADPTGPASWYIKRMITERLRGHIALTLLEDRPGLWLQPDSLLTTLYMLFAREIAYPGEREGEMRECLRCGQPFERTGRRDYCSRSCQNAADYEKHKEERRQKQITGNPTSASV